MYSTGNSCILISKFQMEPIRTCNTAISRRPFFMKESRACPSAHIRFFGRRLISTTWSNYHQVEQGFAKTFEYLSAHALQSILLSLFGVECKLRTDGQLNRGSPLVDRRTIREMVTETSCRGKSQYSQEVDFLDISTITILRG
jgi:hypothetical protein